MSRITDPIQLAQQIAGEYRECYGGDLVSLILFGSAAGKEFNHDRSDINLLIVLSSMSLPLLEKSLSIQDRWAKKRCPRPLFMDKNYIANSLDTFPIEFLDMQGSYRVLHGEDVLGPLRISHAHLRLQIERELKGKRLHLVREWLEAKRSPARVADLARVSLASFAPAFRGMLHLRKELVPRDRMALALAIQTAFGFDNKPFQSILEALHAKDSRQIIAVFPAYAEAIERLIRIIDQLIPKEEDA